MYKKYAKRCVPRAQGDEIRDIHPKLKKHLAGKYFGSMCVFKNISLPHFNSRTIFKEKPKIKKQLFLHKSVYLNSFYLVKQVLKILNA